MTDDELLDELERRLRKHVDPEVTYDGDAFVLHRWDGAVQDPPLLLHATAAQLARSCDVEESTRDALWPSAPVPIAGLNLLQMHLERVVSQALTRAPHRRHVVLHPRLAVLSDPAVPDEPDPPRPPRPQRPDGRRLFAHAPLAGQTYTPRPQPPPGGRCHAIARTRRRHSCLSGHPADGAQSRLGATSRL
ncbi:hypothetical protein AB2L27_10915 [Kineococcus sp. LSe6-4]|uniref:Uncharacterized protein n=1 Tax=Kineococcus halophytocola TaxID=3234027 RepID=A0ABV4H122_9ACTN